MAFPEGILPAIPLNAARSTAMPEQTTMRNRMTPNILRFTNISRNFMLPTTMPVIIMLSGPIMEATSLKAMDTGSGRAMPVNSRISPANTAKTFGFNRIFLMFRVPASSNIRIPTVQNITLKTRIYPLV